MDKHPLLTVSGLQRKYKEVLAVDVKLLEIFENDLLCLMGPTGAGKSTLMRMLAAVEPPSAGSVRFAGEIVALNSPLSQRRKIAMVFQRPQLLARSVRENVAYGLQIRGEKNTRAQVDALLERFELTRMADQIATTLSGGQSQLVGIARAMIVKPDVLLLDEPTANLDPALVALVERAIAEEHASRKLCVVWATHNLFQARRVARRAALMLKGKLIEIGTTDEFFHSPRDSRTLDFIEGRMIY